MYTEIDASAGPAALAHCGGSASRSSCCSSVRPRVSTVPTSKAPMSAPRIEPMPPITTTTKARIRMFSPIPTCTASSGASRLPATAHKPAPRPNTSVNSRPTFTPMAALMSRLAAPARTSAPIRVFCTSRYSSSAVARPTPMINSRQDEYTSPGRIWTGPSSACGIDRGRSLPKSILTPSLRIRISANVASTCDRWSRAYRVRRIDASSSMPNRAVSSTAPSAPSRKEPLRRVSQAARKAPTMYSDPCARLIMSMTPKTSVSPAASRNSMKPSCRPLSVCSTIRRPLIGLRCVPLTCASRTAAHRRRHGRAGSAR